MYSASVLDIAALFCLFDDQLISLSPRNCKLPDVPRSVSWQPAGSTSANAVNATEESFRYHRPRLTVPCRIESKHLYTSWVPQKSGKHHSSRKELAHGVATLWKLVERVDRLYLLGEGASWSIVVEECELVDSACTGRITSAIRAINSGAGGSTLGGRLDSRVHQTHEGMKDQVVYYAKAHMVSCRDEVMKDHVAKIMGYGDYTIGNVTISMVTSWKDLGIIYSLWNSFVIQTLKLLFANTLALTQSPVIPQDVEEDIHDIEVAHMRNDPLFGMTIPEVAFDQSSSTVSPHIIVQPDHQIPQHNSKWTNDHPLDNIIGQLSRPVSIRLQLHEQALFGYYDAFLTSVEPTTYKDALTQSYEDKEWKAVDPLHYRGMIGTLIYLTAIRPDLQFAICMRARYQARPTKKHIHAVKRIFRYLHGTVNRGLWYLKDSSVALTAFADVDPAGCQDTLRGTSGSLQFLGERLISWSSKRQKSAAISSTEAEYISLSGGCA
nr:uncharacterized mitochondrial protein AtMg00810-like [Tanacetum cinerariifolium]